MLPIREVYNAFVSSMETTDALLTKLKEVAIYSVCPPLEDRVDYIKPITRALFALRRFNYRHFEEPNQTFMHPGMIVVPQEVADEIGELVSAANASREVFEGLITRIRTEYPEEKLKLALVHYHKENNLPPTIPIVGTPDRIKFRQVTRKIYFVPNAIWARFTLEEKKNIRTIDPTAYAERLQGDGYSELSMQVAGYKKGELKKVYPSTFRWRVSVKTPNKKDLKVTTPIPVILSPAGDELPIAKGIDNNGIQEKPPRLQRSDKKTLVLAIEECDLYVYK